MNIPINETPATEDELDLDIQVITPQWSGNELAGLRWRYMSRAEALELFPMSPHPIPETTKEMMEATEHLNAMIDEVRATMSPPLATPRSTVAFIDTVVDGAMLRRFIVASEFYKLSEPEWPMTLVISQHHFEDPEFMKLLGEQPYVVTPRYEPGELRHAARMVMKDIVERGHIMMEAHIEPATPEQQQDYRPRPSFRDRFPNDPVRNRRARQHMGRQGSRARGQKS